MTFSEIQTRSVGRNAIGHGGGTRQKCSGNSMIQGQRLCRCKEWSIGISSVFGLQDLIWGAKTTKNKNKKIVARVQRCAPTWRRKQLQRFIFNIHVYCLSFTTWTVWTILWVFQYIVTWRLKVRIVEREEMSIARLQQPKESATLKQRLCKHVNAATNIRVIDTL
jgi:hypothetical protein